MKQTDSKNIWQFRQAKDVKLYDKFILLVLSAAGLFSIINLMEWWFQTKHIVNFPLFVILSTFFWYGIFRIILIWINYLGITKPPIVPKPKDGLSVAIFTTSAPGEPVSMYEKTLEALSNVTYPHTTYLLDSTQDPDFKVVAEKYGAVYLDLANLPGAKAGKVNKALSMTTEEFILILDPDHIAFPNFLDQTLGFFEDEKVGFVQVSQGYYNQYRSFTAAGAAEQTYSFYGPTQMGLHGFGAPVAIGANCTFRRKAFESIGGHAEALAEDLVTSMRIHAAGWKSVYNPVIVNRGLVPEDFGSFAKQQLKWARGVFEVLFVDYPQLFKKFTFWQKFSYGAISFYYFTGLMTLFFILIPPMYFMTGIIPANMNFAEFLTKGTPIAIIALAIYLYVQKFMVHPATERGFHWRGMILKYSLWPIYFLAFVLSILNHKIPYIPTAKKAVIGSLTPFARPLIWYNIFFLFSVILVFFNRKYYVPESELLFTSARTWGMIGFSILAFVQSTGGILAAMEALRLKEEIPWDHIDVNNISTKIIKK